jgi:hypothetical protein
MRRFDERKNRLTTGLGTPAHQVRGRAEDGKEPCERTEKGPGEGRGKEREKRLRQTLCRKQLR